MEIKDTKDIIYDNYKIHHTKLGKDIRPKKHDTKKWVAVDDLIKKIEQLKEKINFAQHTEEGYYQPDIDYYKIIDKAFEDVVKSIKTLKGGKYD